jgi:formylglycine-generating enzyme required for sulfatase activity
MQSLPFSGKRIFLAAEALQVCTMAHDVFISYPHQDKAVADAACAKLEAQGIRCWIAPRDIAPSAEWAASIVQAIDKSKVMVLIFSSYANQSKQVHREVQQAFDGEKPVVPFRIENVLPENTLRYYMGSVHWLDALTAPIEQHLEKLVVSVVALVGAPISTEESRIERDAVAKEAAEAEQQQVGDERLWKERHGEEEQPLKRAVPRKGPRSAVLIGSLIGFILLGTIGAWLKLAPSPAAPGVPQQTTDFPLSATQEKALKSEDTFKECTTCPVMKVVPAGSFTMGSLVGEFGRYSDEGPQHSVRILRQFAIGQFELMFDEWDACIAGGGCNGYKPSDVGWGRGRRPVVNVSWDDAVAYVAWLSKMTGKPYRLLSEAEYEYATRAGTTTAYPWGNDIGENNANCNGCGSQGDNRQTAPVGSFLPNQFGLFDMVGNVWVWIEDCYHKSYSDAPADGSAWISGDCTSRVIRSGSWHDDPKFLRSASRFGFESVRNHIIGLRIGRTLLAP